MSSCSKLTGNHACMDFYPIDAHVNADVTFLSNCSTGYKSFSWNFGDGGTDNSSSPNHKYQTAGTFIITMVATDGSTSDTAKSEIIVTP